MNKEKTNKTTIALIQQYEVKSPPTKIALSLFSDDKLFLGLRPALKFGYYANGI